MTKKITKMVVDNRNEPNGLTLCDGSEGDLAEGLGTHELAEKICKSFGISYPYENNIGSRLKVCCEAIDKGLTDERGIKEAKMEKQSSKKCFICGNIVTNENINKDGHYFCSNDCEAIYWHKYVYVNKETNKKIFK